ncbi:MAG: glycoside hydrolase family 15 protein, partial [Methanobacteriota archaeon]
MTRPYKPISDYAAIGDLQTVVLVGRDGSIDWCPFPHLDSPSVFGAILDARRGGRFGIAAPEAGMGDQRYIPDTNVLQTRFRTERGALTVTDFMPLSGEIGGAERVPAASEIHRIIECSEGNPDVEVEWSPRFDYGRTATRIVRSGTGWVATDGKDTLALGGAGDAKILEAGSGPVLSVRFRLDEGERRVLIARWNSLDTSGEVASSEAMLKRTADIWKGWAHREGTLHSENWAGHWLPFLIRSELALKLLTHADTGAIAAAPTTSLPESIGGVRNWDYRYSWIRDASQAAQAFIALGHRKEAIEFLEWIERVSEQHFEHGEPPQIMYGIHGEAELGEQVLDHLEGYRGSRPVRIGNGAAGQTQHEVYGELLVTGYELLRRGEALNHEIMDLLGWVADHVCTVWREPDHG